MEGYEIREQIDKLQGEISRIAVQIGNLESVLNNVSDKDAYLQELSSLRTQLNLLNSKLYKLEAEVKQKEMTECDVNRSGIQQGYQYGSVSVKENTNTNGFGDINNLGKLSGLQSGYTIKTKESKAKKDEFEQNIGKNVMSVLASLLIFIGLFSLGALVFENLGDVVKAGIIHLVSFIILGVGLWRVKVQKNAFSISLSAIGIGSVYIGIFVDCYLSLISLPFMGVLLGVWSIINLWIAYRYKSSLYTVISYIGFQVATTLGLIYYIDQDILMMVLFIMQLFFNAIVLNAKYTNEIQFQNIMSYLMLIYHYLIMFGLYLRYGFDSSDFPLWFLLGGAIVVIYLIYTLYAYYQRDKLCDDKNSGFNCYLFFSLLFYAWNTRFTVSALSEEYQYFLYIVFALILLAGILFIHIKKINSGIAVVFNYVSSILITSYLLRVNHNESYCILGIILISLYIGLMVYLLHKYKRSESLHIASITYFVTSFIYLSYWNYVLDSFDVLVAFLILLFSVGIFVIVVNGMLMKHNLFDKFMAIFGLTLGMNYFLGYISMIDVISFKLETFMFITLNVALISFVLLSGFGSTWNTFSDLLIKSKETKYDGLFYTYRVFSYLSLIYVLIGMWDINEYLGYMIIYTLYVLLLCFMNTTYIMTRYKQCAGYILGFKCTVLCIALLNIFSGRVELTITYSIICMLIAIACILIGFYLTNKSFRLYGLMLSVISVLKLVFIDISYENSISRILGYILGGILCLIIVFIYNKLESNTKVENTGSEE